MIELDMLESAIFSRLKAKFSPKIKAKYKDLNFTTSDKSSTKPQFPTVYIHMMESPEIGETLEGTEISGVNTSFQIDVLDNQNNSRTDEVAKEVLKVMKSMCFKPIVMPRRNNAADVYITTARYRRTIGAGDKL